MAEVTSSDISRLTTVIENLTNSMSALNTNITPINHAFQNAGAGSTGNPTRTRDIPSAFNYTGGQQTGSTETTFQDAQQKIQSATTDSGSTGMEGMARTIFGDAIGNFFVAGGTLNEIISNALNGNIADALKTFNKDIVPILKISDGLKEWGKLNDEIFKTGRNLGRLYPQMQEMSTAIVKNSEDLGRFFNIQPDELIKTLEEVSDATGRVKLPSVDDMWNQAYMRQYGATDLVGAFDDIGGSSSVATANFIKLQQNASALGLNLSKAKNALKENINLVNKLNFKDGVSGLEKMVLLSQQMKLNVQDIEKMSEKLQDVEGAIDASATINALGGNMASQFSNPLDLMYMANFDAEEMMTTLQSSLQGMAKFNWETGSVDISNIDKRRIKELAKALGLNSDELLKSANRQGLARAMEGQMSQDLTQAQRDMVTNRAEYNAEKGVFEVTLSNGQQMDLSKINSQNVGQVVSNRVEDAQLDIRNNVRDIAQMMKLRMKTRSTEDMSWSEVLNSAKSANTKDWMNRADVMMKSKSVGGAGLEDSAKDILAHDAYSANTYQTLAGLGEIVGKSDNAMQTVANFFTNRYKSVLDMTKGSTVGVGLGILSMPFGGIDAMSQLGGLYDAGSMFERMSGNLFRSNGVYLNNDYRLRPNDPNIPYFSQSDNLTNRDDFNIGRYDWTTMNDTHHWNYSPSHWSPAMGMNPATNNSQGTGSMFTLHPFDNLHQVSSSVRGVYNNSGSVPSGRSAQEAHRGGTSSPSVSGSRGLYNARPSNSAMSTGSVASHTYSGGVSSDRTPRIVTQSARGGQRSLQAYNYGGRNRVESNAEVVHSANQVEGVVSIDDPLLMEKALVSVVKIHELLVAKYGSMEVRRTDVVVASPTEERAVMPLESPRSGGTSASSSSSSSSGSSSRTQNNSVLNIHVDGSVRMDQGTLNKEAFEKMLVEAFATQLGKNLSQTIVEYGTNGDYKFGSRTSVMD